MKRLLSLIISLVMTLSVCFAVPPVQAFAADTIDPEFQFSKESNLLGEYDIEWSGHTYTFDCYQAKYCDAPFTNDDWANAEDYFKLNIKVIKAIDGEAVTIDEETAPILVVNPWGGDNGSPVMEPTAYNNGRIPYITEAMENGWIVVEPSMRGLECIKGTAGEEGYYCYGKIPGPLADLKAAIRYLRYGDNATTIPGDKEKIWITGHSSGGDASVVIGASGNSPYFDKELEAINALPGRDDVYGVMACCPVMTREWSDVCYAWEYLGDVSEDEEAEETNRFLTGLYADYQASLDVKAIFETENIKVGDQLTADNMKEYIWEYIKASAIKYLNSLGSKEKIDEYIASEMPASMMYSTTAMPRNWLKPVYAADGVTVVDIDNTYEEFWNYALGARYDKKVALVYNYDKACFAPDDCHEGNGTVNTNVGAGLFAKNAVASNFSFGKGSDYAASYSIPGIMWMEEHRGMTISQEYLDLYEYQRNCTDPLYFIKGDGAEEATNAQHWIVRSGAPDFCSTYPSNINLICALANKGIDADLAFVWDEGHQYTSDRASLWAFSSKANAPAAPQITNKWVKEGCTWVYYKADGTKAANEWLKINGKWYLFGADGTMLTGWQKVGGKWYLLSVSGAMLTGWHKIAGKWYCLSTNGAMLTGWQKIAGKWYYMNADGSMAANKWIGKYYVNNSGAWTKTR